MTPEQRSQRLGPRYEPPFMVLKGFRRSGKTVALLGGAVLLGQDGVVLFISPTEQLGRHAIGFLRRAGGRLQLRSKVRFYTAQSFEFAAQMICELKPVLVVVDEVQRLSVPKDRRLGRTVVSAFRKLSVREKVTIWVALGEAESAVRRRHPLIYTGAQTGRWNAGV